ncbi:hypothetical protein BC831DRAFT_452527 [Entophlyctis helioformis]|nr:hypothetical protein BC831DRAFT_452527 [Entophlyctis helioformis]
MDADPACSGNVRLRYPPAAASPGDCPGTHSTHSTDNTHNNTDSANNNTHSADNTGYMPVAAAGTTAAPRRRYFVDLDEADVPLPPLPPFSAVPLVPTPSADSSVNVVDAHCHTVVRPLCPAARIASGRRPPAAAPLVQDGHLRLAVRCVAMVAVDPCASAASSAVVISVVVVIVVRAVYVQEGLHLLFRVSVRRTKHFVAVPRCRTGRSPVIVVILAILILPHCFSIACRPARQPAARRSAKAKTLAQLHLRHGADHHKAGRQDDRRRVAAFRRGEVVASPVAASPAAPSAAVSSSAADRSQPLPIPSHGTAGLTVTLPQPLGISPPRAFVGGDVRSMTVPVSRPPLPRHIQLHSDGTYHNKMAAHAAACGIEEDLTVDTAYLRTVNTSGRRGFVDLDSVGPTGPPLTATAPTPTPSASKPPVVPILAASPLNPASVLSPSATAMPKGQTKEQQQQHDAESRVITHPGVWDNINLCFLPTAKNFLGEGRYAQVYLGHYSVMAECDSDNDDEDDMDTSDTSMQNPASASAATPSSQHHAKQDVLRQCAIKRMNPTTEAQSIGLAEAYILRKLAHAHPNIISLIAVKDESDLDGPLIKSRLVQSLESPMPSASPSLPTPLSAYTKRQTSPVRAPVSPTTPTCIAVSPKLPDASPRLLLMLEYLPMGNMWDWAQTHKSRVGKALWIKWARELAGALEAVHSFGIVHHDIKPHNILLSDVLDVRLADFGNACFVPEMDPTQIAANFGSPSTIPPRLFSGTADQIPVSLSPSKSPSLLATATATPPPLSSSSTLAPGGDATRTDRIFNPQTGSGQLKPHADSSGVPALSPLSATPTSSRFVLPGSPISPHSQSLTNGLGRGTLAYSAPDLLSSASTSTPYSFPVDMYSLGVTLYALIAGVEPFALARSSVHMMVGIQRGFFASGLQTTGGDGRPGVGGVVGDPVDGVWRFQSGEAVPRAVVELVMRLVDRDPGVRPSARETLATLEHIDARL